MLFFYRVKKGNNSSIINITTYIGWKSTKFQMNPMKDVEGVEETRFLTYKAYVSMGNNSVKNRSIKTPKTTAHLHVIGRKST